jgi:hypothetical protein
LRQTLANGVLFSLFETSLKAFRAQAFLRSNSKNEKGLDAFVRDRVKGWEADGKVEKTWFGEMQKAKEGCRILDYAKSYGLKDDPSTLQQTLCEAAKDVKHWWGPVHGDLHAGNVMVRRSDAIIIDFGSIGDGPPTADPATLEVSLVFTTDSKDRPDQFDEWKQFVDSAYDTLPCIRPPIPGSERTPFTWLQQSVRELRHTLFGCDSSDDEIAVVLAAYLMRLARLPVETFDDPQLQESAVLRLHDLAIRRRAYGIVIAEKLLRSIAAKP